MDTTIERTYTMTVYAAFEIKGEHNDLIMISVRDHSDSEDGSKFINFKATFKDVLILKFDDIDQPLEFEGVPLKLFDDGHAKEIIEFVMRHKDSAKAVIIHCNAGVSRSPAIAKFISDMLDLPFNHKYDLYNKLVYRVLRNTYYGTQYTDS